MEYTRLGRTGLRVSRLCLGTLNFGSRTSEPDSFAIMQRAVDVGLNFFDTANAYGRKLGEGVCEAIIGRWLAQGGGRRDQVVLATKVHNRMGHGPNDERLSAYHIRRACDESLRRLQTDRIDLYQMHHIDRSTPWEEIWQAIEVLVQQGKVLYVGSSNFAGWHIAQAQAEAKARSFMGLVCEQALYNLTQRTVELEIAPACRTYGLGLIAYSPLERGLLAGRPAGRKTGRWASAEMQAAAKKHARQLKSYEKLCATLGEKPATVALAWLLHSPDLTAPIIGPRTLEQLDESLLALDVKLDADTLKALDAIWPGPGGEAPEAFAW